MDIEFLKAKMTINSTVKSSQTDVTKMCDKNVWHLNKIINECLNEFILFYFMIDNTSICKICSIHSIAPKEKCCE